MTDLITNTDRRSKILEIEDLIKAQPNHFEGNGVETPTTHHFAEGVYVREMFVPKDTLITGKIHNLEHVNILLAGHMLVVTEEGSVDLKGPCIFVSPPGTKKAGYAVTDCTFANCHPNPKNFKNPDLLEKTLVSDTYEEFQKTIDVSKLRRLKNRIIKLLSCLGSQPV